MSDAATTATAAGRVDRRETGLLAGPTGRLREGDGSPAGRDAGPPELFDNLRTAPGVDPDAASTLVLLNAASTLVFVFGALVASVGSFLEPPPRAE